MEPVNEWARFSTGFSQPSISPSHFIYCIISVNSNSLTMVSDTTVFLLPCYHQPPPNPADLELFPGLGSAVNSLIKEGPWEIGCLRGYHIWNIHFFQFWDFIHARQALYQVPKITYLLVARLALKIVTVNAFEASLCLGWSLWPTRPIKRSNMLWFLRLGNKKLAAHYWLSQKAHWWMFPLGSQLPFCEKLKPRGEAKCYELVLFSTSVGNLAADISCP